MDEISVKGKKYLKAKVLARELGYTNDYVGQLCRGGKVEAELVGRTWYVNPDSIKGHKQTRYRSTKASTHKELKINIRQVTKEAHSLEREHFYTHRGFKLNSPQIAYENDEAELLPTPMKDKSPTQITPYKLPVELADSKQVSIDTETSEKYHFEAQEKSETKFFGTLKVTNFVTEVPLEGEPEVAQKVRVSGNINEVHKIDRKNFLPSMAGRGDKFSSSKLAPTTVANAPQLTSIPVEVDGETIRLPFVYHVITAAAFVLAIMTAVTCISLEANILANTQILETRYTFESQNLTALLYLVK